MLKKEVGKYGFLMKKEEMMKKIKYYIIGLISLICIYQFILILFYRPNIKKDLDKLIEKYDSENFNDLKGITIYYRGIGKTPFTSIYILYKNLVKRSSLYVVETNRFTNNVISIKQLECSNCEQNYFNNYHIEKIIKDYFKYDICSISVDENENISLSPYAGSSSLLMRVKDTSVLREKKWFELYKGNWYIDKSTRSPR